ncbi:MULTISPECIES: DUF2188 domain-containing protein [Staphylococcus]|uniref:DUF2188 domain-containing protein n=1 Tax=Staphylococcus lugdunensis TaxID=28035 RepID=A0ABX6BRC7_STALU|nr:MULTISPECIES: DUF2188 domain-containing protein [Staphylococcus]ADC86650.1 hypothetical protein SLGD_00502 [Staphylococcus lugdunensis HKU09-01]ARB76954.1 DUF2188 domain-containing protein [Staphylococcus lugdunensis]ARJ08390.1 hypothetical protein B7454_03010 [Staphylococcus lugdunensis]ARJ15474.1 hypothetical protein B6N54_02250 [Staphylococcus lugdunensis]ARJ18001.1 hypothetical protein B7467_02970 [Staphylococcus lugdunensis]
MPWTMSDYPPSWKNLAQLERKKAIDIGNAMLKDGYDEHDVIPIATQQAEKWYQDATESELEQLKHKHITQHEKDNSAQPQLNDHNVHVYFEDEKWKVKTSGAKQATATYNTKKQAVERAQKIAENRHTHVITHKKNSQ